MNTLNDDGLDASFTLSEDEVKSIQADIKEVEEKINEYADILKLHEDKLNKIAIAVMFKLTKYAEILDDLPEGELNNEIILEARSKEFTVDKLLKLGEISVRHDKQDGTLTLVAEDLRYHDTYYIICFPFSYIYRADWIYKLEIELGAYKLKNNNG